MTEEETGTLAERCQQAGDAGYGDALSMQDLEDKVFQVIDFTPGESEGKWGTRRWNLARVIIEDGEDTYEGEAFLSGNRVNRVLDMLQADGELPIRARILRRSDLQGTPWDLVPADSDLPMDGDLPLAEELREAVESEAKPVDSPVTAAAKKAGAVEVDRKTVVTLRHKGGKQADMEWDEFCGAWQKEGFGLDELGDICGATSAQAVSHWFAANKNRTITTLKNEATKRRKPLEEAAMPFE